MPEIVFLPRDHPETLKPRADTIFATSDPIAPMP